jgi:hypothetical protein
MLLVYVLTLLNVVGGALTRAQRQVTSTCAASDWACYHTNDVSYRMLLALQTRYPGMAYVYSIGKSVNGMGQG